MLNAIRDIAKGHSFAPRSNAPGFYTTCSVAKGLHDGEALA